MSYTIIETSQAPDAKPIGLTVALTDTFQTIIDVPSFEVPELVFGGDTVIVPGVAEIISPMLVSNITTQSSFLTLRIYRFSSNTSFTIANNIPVPKNDIVSIPLNGQFIATGDLLEAKADNNASLTVTISYTIGQAEQDDVA